MSDSDPNSLLLLGEIRGQLREMIHTNNNLASKLDAVALRVSALETDKNRRDGATGVLQAIVKSPAIAWFISIAAVAWAALSGRTHP